MHSSIFFLASRICSWSNDSIGLSRLPIATTFSASGGIHFMYCFSSSFFQLA